MPSNKIKQGIVIYEKKKIDNREFWQKHVRSWRASGMSQADYCRLHGLKNHRLTYYKLQEDKRTSAKSTATGGKQSRAEKLFLPVKMVSPVGGSMRVILDNGVSIEFDNNSDPVWLGKVLGSIAR